MVTYNKNRIEYFPSPHQKNLLHKPKTRGGKQLTNLIPMPILLPIHPNHLPLLLLLLSLLAIILHAGRGNDAHLHRRRRPRDPVVP